MSSILRVPLLFARRDQTVTLIPDGGLAADERGRITFVGPWAALQPQLGSDARIERVTHAVAMPPMLDLHTHVSQHRIRGHFLDGVEDSPPSGRLVAGLQRNVFPAEMKCADPDWAAEIAREFAADARARGVVGGAAYMTIHPAAADAALRELGEAWHVGLVLMDQNCPEGLRSHSGTLEADVARLAEKYGRRLIVTDRFALGCSSRLRRLGVALSHRHGLRMQTHLNEQIAEKRMVEQTLYPNIGSYTGVYARDGLLGRAPILAHCIHHRREELELLGQHPVTIAHCPVSNTLLGSGIMPLDQIAAAGLDWCLCTDVGASPSTSLLVEMAQFLIVHRGRSPWATPSAALYRSTLAPARALGLDHRLGTFEPGMPLAYVQLQCDPPAPAEQTDHFIERKLLGLSDADFTTPAAALQKLATGAALAAGELLALHSGVEHRARRLEPRVQRVVADL